MQRATRRAESSRTRENAGDFRKLYARTELHTGLVIIITQVAPARQRDLLATVFNALDPEEDLVNQVIEIDLEAGGAVFTRYVFPSA